MANETGKKVEEEWVAPFWKHPIFVYTILHIVLIGIIGSVAWVAWNFNLIPK